MLFHFKVSDKNQNLKFMLRHCFFLNVCMFCANRLCVFPFSHDLCVYFLRLLFLLCIFLSFLCISNTTQCYSFTIQPKVNNLNTISSLPPPILSFILENNVRGDCNENTNCVQKCDHGNKKTGC